MESGISKSKARFCTQSKCGTWMHYSRDPVVSCFEGVTTFISTSYALPLGSSHMRVEAGNPHRNMCVKQCHKPPMTGNGLDIPTYTNWDDSGDGTNGISHIGPTFWHVHSATDSLGFLKVCRSRPSLWIRCCFGRSVWDDPEMLDAETAPSSLPKKTVFTLRFSVGFGWFAAWKRWEQAKKWSNWILLPEILMM